MTHQEAAIAYFSKDVFAYDTVGLRAIEAEPGRAVAQLRIEERHLNGIGGVMGGVLLTLGDFTTALADFEEGRDNTTVSSSMQFIGRAKDDLLVCTAIAEKSGRTMGYYRAEVRDGQDNLVAVGQYTLLHLWPNV